MQANVGGSGLKSRGSPAPSAHEVGRGHEEALMVLRPAVGDPPAGSSVLDVDLDAIAHNVGELRRRYPDVTFVAALKANAYGFGLLPVARTVLAVGADQVAVARLEHALELRAAGIRVPIVLYAGLRPEPDLIAAVARNDVTVTIVDEADMRAYATTSEPIRALVKVDVGLGRLGIEPDAAAGLIRAIAAAPSLELAGVYTHVHVPPGAVADVSRYVRWQFERFRGVLDEAEAARIEVPLRIAASSGALRLTDDMGLNGIDVGTLLFGLDPPGPSDRDLALRPALVRLATRLSQVRDVERHEFAALSPIPTGRPVRLGVIPFGAADGFLGISTGEVLIGGRRARVLAISLEHTRLDLTGIDAGAGDEVVIIGRQGDDAITVQQIAAAKGLYGTAQVPVLIAPGVTRRYAGGASGAV